MKATDIIKSILDGKFDGDLQFIKGAVIERQNDNAPSATGFRMGQTVKFNSKTRPTYLIGAKATVMVVNRKRVKVKLHDDCYKGRFTGLINTSTNLLDKQ